MYIICEVTGGFSLFGIVENTEVCVFLTFLASHSAEILALIHYFVLGE